MSAIIYNRKGEPLKQSHNLRAILRHGKPVELVRVDVLSDPGRPGAYVTVFYTGGDYGQIYFVCGSHAQQWAESLSNNRRSLFSGCRVVCPIHEPGAWDYERGAACE